MSNVTALTIAQPAQVPPHIVRPDLANAAGEQFIQQTARQNQARRALPESESIDRRLRRSDDNVSFLRDRRGAEEARKTTERRSEERRSSGQPNRGATPTSSAYLAQLIGQEIAPQTGDASPASLESSVAAYDATIARAEAFIDPYNAYVVSV